MNFSKIKWELSSENLHTCSLIYKEPSPKEKSLKTCFIDLKKISLLDKLFLGLTPWVLVKKNSRLQFPVLKPY